MNNNILLNVTAGGEFLMLAPLFVVTNIFRLDTLAVQRIEAETSNGGQCELFFNYGPVPSFVKPGTRSIVVTRSA